jgi:ribose transport system substrate-binding protein
MYGTARRVLVGLVTVTLALAGCAGTASPSPSNGPTQSNQPSAPSASSAGEPSSEPSQEAAGTCDLAALPPAKDGSEQDEKASVPVDTSKFKSDPPWKLGVSAGYLSNSWVQFNFANLRYAVSKDSRFDPDILFLDANFDVNKQVTDIQDLINAKVDGIIYLAIDDTSIASILQQAVDAGIATVNGGGVFNGGPESVSNAYIDSYLLGRDIAERLVVSMKGKGAVLSILGIPGTSAAVDSDRAIKDVIKVCPDITLLDTQNGDWNRAKSQTIGQNWTQRFPEATAIYSTAGQMSVGVAQAYEQAGMLDHVIFSPGDEYNGWLKWLQAHANNNPGILTQPPAAGSLAVTILADVLQGKQVTKGVLDEYEYVPPTKISDWVEPDAPDDWWPNDLPAEFLPKGTAG